jgi:hypothetical protein
MAFEFAYALDGSTVSNIKDFPLDAVGVSSSGYNIGIANTTKPKKGDCVFLVSGKMRKQYDVATPKPVGVIEGFEFTGLAQAGDYAATAANAGFAVSALDTVKYPNGVAKVRIEADSVYRISPKAGQTVTAGLIGGSYNVFIDTANNNNQQIDITASTNAVVKVVDVDIAKNVLFVMMVSNNTF